MSDEGESDPVDNVSILLIFVSSIDLNFKFNWAFCKYIYILVTACPRMIV